MLAIIPSGALQGIAAQAVSVEVNTGEAGKPEIVLVGLPDASVKESEDRVTSAIANSGFRMPRTRTTINLAPGHIRKEGPLYDLPIALGLLQSTEQLRATDLDDYLIAGELSLSGQTRPVRGGLALARLARELGKRGVLLPELSAREAALVEGIAVYAVASLAQAVSFLSGEQPLTPLPARADFAQTATGTEGELDFAEVKGQASLRRAVEVAVSGGHNLIMFARFTPWMDYLHIIKRLDGPLLPDFPENAECSRGTPNLSIRVDRRQPYLSPHAEISQDFRHVLVV